jgi:alkylation response protein AidB-like acyl-CoA dehydrogenase
VDLALTAEQVALVASFTGLLSQRSTTAHVRAAEPLGFDASLWRLMLDVGVLEMAVPEADGGWGADLVDMVLVAERTGAALAPVPSIETQCAARLLAGLRSDAAAAALQAVLAGDSLVTMAVCPGRGGKASLVPAGAVADAAIVLNDDALLLVSLNNGNRQPVANLASAPLADIEIAKAIGESASLILTRGPDAIAAFEKAIDEWLTLTAAALIGSATAAHLMTCAYARERHTWGRPIGAYQAVAHPLADGATALDGARLLARKAAWALGGGQERGGQERGSDRGRELAAMAFAFAAETARDVTYGAVHFHGGYGFTLEHDAQLHYRRARGWARVWGEPRKALLRAASARYLKED